MRLLLTIEAGPDRSEAHRGSGWGSVTQYDIALTYSPETRVRDLAAALAGSAEAAPANVVALPGAAGVPTLTGPLDLYLGGELLEPEQRIDESPVRHGVVLGLGAPSSQRDEEPRGVVEVRISSGPGAGHVHRLGIGRATLGPGRHCAIRIPELAGQSGLEDVEEVLVVEVAPDGTVTITPDPEVEGREMPMPLRREPVTAPIVLEASSMSETSKRRRLRRKKKAVTEFQLGERIDPGDAVPLVHLDRRPLTGTTPVSYTHLTLPTICSV